MKKPLLITIALGAIVLAGCSNSPATDKNLDNFAKCLTEKGAMIYTSETCSHCQNQKKLFGDSWQYIKNVECNKNPQVCSDAGIQGVPNWVVNGEDLLWEQTLEILAEKSGCEL